MIGGAVEPGESPWDAARRETAEETGVEVSLSGIRAVIGGPRFQHTYPNGDQVAFVSTVFDARIVSGTPVPDDDETTEVAWFDPAELAAGARDAPGSPLDESLPRAGARDPRRGRHRGRRTGRMIGFDSPAADRLPVPGPLTTVCPRWPLRSSPAQARR